MYQFRKIFKNTIDPSHLELCKKLIELYGDILLPNPDPQLGLFEHAMAYGHLCIPGWYAVEVNNKPIGIVSGISHLGKIQVDVAFLPEYHGKPIIKEAFTDWCHFLTENTDEPLIVELDRPAAIRFFKKCGWSETELPNQLEFRG